ncbi:ABC transporter permease [candidate division KSB1 bacterium]|nr:ABC transporter permease [candidate division KSB1 bacterium]
MLKNYLKTAARNLMKHKVFTAINITGLSLGIACCLLIFLFIQQEWRHDRFHEKSDRIFRVVRHIERENGEISLNSLQPYEIAAALRDEFLSVIHATAYLDTELWIRHGEDLFFETIGFVDPEFLEIFSFPLLAGDSKTAMSGPQSILISERVAGKFFRGLDFSRIPGQVITLPQGEQREFLITGIFKNVPQTSSLQFDALVPFKHHADYGRHMSSGGSYSVYLETRSREEAKPIETGSASLIKRFLEKDVRKLSLQPLTDIYLNERIHNFYESQSKPLYSQILGGIAFLILFIACVNFMMLSAGRSASRRKEVGIRKVVGAQRMQLIQQFLGEGIVLSVSSLGTGTLLTLILLPSFNHLAQKQISFSLFNNWPAILFLFCLTAFIGIIAGSYPAILLSRVQPGELLKPGGRRGGKNRLTGVFVTLQFAISIALIVGTIVILKQTRFMRAKNVGFEKDQVVSIALPEELLQGQTQLLKAKILQSAKVINVTGSDRNFVQGRLTSTFKNENGKVMRCRWLRIDPDFLKTFGVDLIDGRNLPEYSETGSTFSVLVNESFVKAAGWKTVIGKTIPDISVGEKNQIPHIVGVARDFHFDSMREKIQPLAMHMHPEFNTLSTLFVRIQPADFTETISHIRNVWREVVHGYPFLYSFLDKDLDSQYKTEERWNKITGYAAFLSIVISCLGLLGLAFLMITRKTREIGIRKVLGASVMQIVSLLSSDFMRLTLIANLIAWPVAWFAMTQWLRSFAYRIELSIFPFLFAGLLDLVIVLLTVSWLTVRAATANPVDVLKHE